MAVSVVVEKIQYGKIPDGQHQSAPVNAAGKLIGIWIDVFLTAAEPPGLSGKKARAIQSRGRSRSARDLAIGESAQPAQPRQRHTLRYLRIEIKLSSAP